jgi:hypothetical protein
MFYTQRIQNCDKMSAVIPSETGGNLCARGASAFTYRNPKSFLYKPMQKTFLKSLATLLLILVMMNTLLSCSNTVDKEPLFPASVICVLTAGEKTQTLFLLRLSNFRTANAVFSGTDSLHISRADVSLNGRLMLERDSGRATLQRPRFFYALDSLLIRPDSTYKLTINFTGNTITGTTRVPEPFRITSPVNAQFISLQATRGILSVTLPERTTIKRYRVDVTGPPTISVNSNGDSSVFRSQVKVEVDASRRVQIPLNSFYIGETVVKAIGFDANYERHVYQGFPAGGIENAYGILGSAVVDSVVIRVVQ